MRTFLLGGGGILILLNIRSHFNRGTENTSHLSCSYDPTKYVTCVRMHMHMQAHQLLVIHLMKKNLLLNFPILFTLLIQRKKSDYVVWAWHDVRGQFDTPDSLKEKLVEHFPNDLPTSLQFKVGYFKGRGSTKRWIFEARDLQTMYSSADKGSKTINLWCEGKTEQDENDSSPPAKKSRSSVKSMRREQLEEVDDIFEQLKEKHQDMTAPKLHLWARLIQSGHHDDYDTPPNIPLITGSSFKPKKEECC